jgi:hypothetical protein
VSHCQEYYRIRSFGPPARRTVYISLLCIFAAVQLCQSANYLIDEAVLAKAKSLFGEPINAKDHIFSLEKTYGVRLTFDNSGRLFSLDVKPLSLLKDPSSDYDEEKDPPLNGSEFQQLIDKIGQLMPVGDWQGQDQLAYGSPTKLVWWRYYDRAFVKMFGSFDNSGPIRWFSVTYILPWHETITQKMDPEFPGGPAYAKAVGGNAYLVRRDEAARIEIGKKTTFNGAREIDW